MTKTKSAASRRPRNGTGTNYNEEEENVNGSWGTGTAASWKRDANDPHWPERGYRPDGRPDEREEAQPDWDSRQHRPRDRRLRRERAHDREEGEWDEGQDAWPEKSEQWWEDLGDRRRAVNDDSRWPERKRFPRSHDDHEDWLEDRGGKGLAKGKSKEKGKDKGQQDWLEDRSGKQNAIAKGKGKEKGKENVQDDWLDDNRGKGGTAKGKDKGVPGSKGKANDQAPDDHRELMLSRMLDKDVRAREEVQEPAALSDSSSSSSSGAGGEDRDDFIPGLDNPMVDKHSLNFGVIVYDLEGIHDAERGTYFEKGIHECSYEEQMIWKCQSQIIEFAAVELITGRQICVQCRPEFSWADVRSHAARLFAQDHGHDKIVKDETLPFFRDVWLKDILPFLESVAGASKSLAIIAHNGDNFDHYVLEKELARHGLLEQLPVALHKFDTIRTVKNAFGPDFGSGGKLTLGSMHRRHVPQAQRGELKHQALADSIMLLDVISHWPVLRSLIAAEIASTFAASAFGSAEMVEEVCNTLNSVLLLYSLQSKQAAAAAAATAATATARTSAEALPAEAQTAGASASQSSRPQQADRPPIEDSSEKRVDTGSDDSDDGSDEGDEKAQDAAIGSRARRRDRRKGLMAADEKTLTTECRSSPAESAASENAGDDASKVSLSAARSTRRRRTSENSKNVEDDGRPVTDARGNGKSSGKEGAGGKGSGSNVQFQ